MEDNLAQKIPTKEPQALEEIRDQQANKNTTKLNKELSGSQCSKLLLLLLQQQYPNKLLQQ